MERFRFDGPLAIRPIRDRGKLLAEFDLVDEETGLFYRAFQLFGGSNGPFVKSPQRAFELDGELRRVPYIHAQRDTEIGRKWFEDLCDAVVPIYEALTESHEEATPAAPTGIRFRRGKGR